VLDILLGLPGPSRRATLVSNGIELFLLRDSPSTDIDTRIWACGSFVLHDLNSIADHTYVSPYGARYLPELAETPLIWTAFLFCDSSTFKWLELLRFRHGMNLRLAIASPVSMTSDIDSPRTACRYYHNKLRCNTTRLATPLGVLPGTIDLAGCI